MSVRPKKSLGQHFLTDPEAVRQIVAAVQAPPGAHVVEIGPGEGALTGALLARYPGLVALEVDPEAVAHLRARFPALDVRQADVLAADWRALAAEGTGNGERGNGAEDEREAGKGEEGRGGGQESAGEADRAGGSAPPVAAASGPSANPPLQSPIPHSPFPIPANRQVGAASAASLHVVGNLPYYITSPILFALLDARAVVARAVVMVQKEVADRLAAPPGSKTYGTLSVYFSLYARATVVVDVPRQAFRPVPNVESAVVALDFAAADPPEVPFPALQRVVRAAFGQRRKMLRNSLGPLAHAAGADLGDFATRRPEAVSPTDFVTLARLLTVD